MRKLSGYGPSLIVLITAMLVLFLGPSAVQRLEYKQTQARMVQAAANLESANVLEQINQAYRDIATFVEPSVVHISAELAEYDRAGNPKLSSGSGWAFDDEGHIVTNYHVVENAERIDVQLASGELRSAQIVGADRSTDIAVLKIAQGRLHPATLGDPTEVVKQGDLVFAFGSPFDFRFSISKGIVSGKGRQANVIRDQAGRSGYENFIQVDAAINPGNSGGPLTDYRGRVIGMNTAIATVRGSSFEEGQFAGIGLAIPLEMIIPVVSQIIDKGFVEKGYLGVRVSDLRPFVAQRLRFVGEGVLIASVEPGGPAALAGVQANDIVIEVNGEPVANRPQLQSIVSSILPGETVTLTIWRPDVEEGTGQMLTATVRLTRLDPIRTRGELPEDQSTEQIIALGIEKMSSSTPAVAERLGAPFHRGVLIERLVAGSELAEAVAAGSTIVAVMDQPVTTVEEFIAELRKYDLRGNDFRGGVRIGLIRPNGAFATVRLFARD